MSDGAFTDARAVLFDVLHTLVDDSGFPRAHLHALLESDGHTLDAHEFEQAYRSVTAREYDWEVAAKEHPFRTIRDRHQARLEALYDQLGLTGKRDVTADADLLWEKITGSRIYPEVPDVLPALEQRGYRLALISNADENDPVIQVLLGADLPVRFEAIVTSESAGAYKPSNRIFERALQELELEPDQVVLVGDSPTSDVLGGHRAGMAVIWVNRRGIDYPDGYPEPDAQVSDLHSLLDVLPGPGLNNSSEAGMEE